MDLQSARRLDEEAPSLRWGGPCGGIVEWSQRSRWRSRQVICLDVNKTVH